MNLPLLRVFIDCGLVGQGILLILLILSVIAWSIIIEKIIIFRKLNRSAENFLEIFRNKAKSRIGLPEINNLPNKSLVYRLYQDGIKELKQIHNYASKIPKTQINEIEQALKRTVSKQAQSLERNMIILATSANVSPLLGLLGTVYGLLVAFHEMGQMGSASIDVVSPGISQALITTVVGLFVAIPSAVGYNYLLNTIKNLITDVENFMSEFLSLLEKGQFQ
ncbi:MotA/TolQ/ExbB proton channel family protein [bacterium]|nr:MotA/TolQ/ExbB proton channel family protein [bacterium]